MRMRMRATAWELPVFLYFNFKEEKSGPGPAEERRRHTPSRHTHRPRLERITSVVIATSLAIISDVADVHSVKKYVSIGNMIIINQVFVCGDPHLYG